MRIIRFLYNLLSFPAYIIMGALLFLMTIFFPFVWIVTGIKYTYLEEKICDLSYYWELLGDYLRKK